MGPQAEAPGTGRHVIVLDIRNVSDSTCELRPFPQIALLDDLGNELPFTFTQSESSLTLPARGSRQLQLVKYRCDTLVQGTATSTVVRSGQWRAQTTLPAQQSGVQVFDYCSGPDSAAGNAIRITVE